MASVNSHGRVKEKLTPPNPLITHLKCGMMAAMVALVFVGLVINLHSILGRIMGSTSVGYTQTAQGKQFPTLVTRDDE
jgi:hypothetical protein